MRRRLGDGRSSSPPPDDPDPVGPEAQRFGHAADLDTALARILIGGDDLAVHVCALVAPHNFISVLMFDTLRALDYHFCFPDVAVMCDKR